ncbi:unnamed protein product [Vitrella brassicaformis CCMP3155]|uniref:SSD domain-containing protein n=2 Tax=Vitrella brassicaformis TaxID=1169539 RepID=A0A0G4EPY9_VITBC|nr:unnamed protein product [Vitrella brassicaformis CCMP3155]|eukprot:CEL99663.1 unnamed protein product [Vitrella brassicaformis CCMP3155]
MRSKRAIAIAIADDDETVHERGVWGCLHSFGRAYCRSVAARPWDWLAICLLTCVVLTGVALLAETILKGTDADWSSGGLWRDLRASILRPDEQDIDWLIPDGPQAQKWDIKKLALEGTDPLPGYEDEERYRVNPVQTVGLIYYADRPEDLFTPSSLQAMCQVERLVVQNPFYTSVCLLSGDGDKCARSEGSIVNLFYGYAHDFSCQLLTASRVGDVKNTLMSEVTYRLRPDARFFLAQGEGPGEGEMTSTRSLIPLGTPLKGYRNEFDRQYTQDKEYLPFWRSLERDILSHLHISPVLDRSPYRHTDDRGWLLQVPGNNTTTSTSIRVALWARPLWFDERADIFYTDQFWAAAAIVLVFVFFALYTKSPMYSFAGCLQIFFSFSLAYLLFRFVAGLNYFGSMQKGALFVLCGMGADNVLVMWDAWAIKQLQYDDQHATRSTQLHHAFCHTAAATLITNLTTAAAFFALCNSPLMPIQAFGLYAGICTVTNYLLTLSLLPPVLVIIKRRREKRSGVGDGVGSRPRSLSSIGPASSVSVCVADNAGTDEGLASHHEADLMSDEGVQKRHEHEHQLDGSSPHPHSPTPSTRISFPFGLSRPPTPYAHAASATPSFFPPEHQSRSPSTSTASLPSSPSPFAYGMSDDDHEQAKGSQREPEEKMTWPRRVLEAVYVRPLLWRWGGVTFVPWVLVGVLLFVAGWHCWWALRLRPTDDTWSQQSFSKDHMFYDVADRFARQFQGPPSLGSYVDLTLFFGIDGIDRPPPFTRWKPTEYRGEVRYDDAFSLDDPATRQFLADLCQEVENKTCDLPICEASENGVQRLAQPGSVICFIRDFNTWQESARSNATDAEGMSLTDRLRRFQSDVTVASGPLAGTPKHALTIGIVEGELKWVAIRFTSTIRIFNRFAPKIALVEWLDDWLGDIRARAPPPLRSAFYEGDREFAETEVLEGMVSGLFGGFQVIFPAVFIVLLVATGNAILSVYAIMSIGAIVVTVMGFIRAVLGWQLGFYECIVGVMTIGFSVDYVIHLGHVYQTATKYGYVSRVDKAVCAVRHMAFTVLAGALTTAAAGLAMQVCQSNGFARFGQLLALAVAFSIVYSLGLFIPLCMVLGPEGHQGSLRHLFRIVSKCCCGSSSKNNKATQPAREEAPPLTDIGHGHNHSNGHDESTSSEQCSSGDDRLQQTSKSGYTSSTTLTTVDREASSLSCATNHLSSSRVSHPPRQTESGSDDNSGGSVSPSSAKIGEEGQPWLGGAFAASACGSDRGGGRTPSHAASLATSGMDRQGVMMVPSCARENG